MDSSRPFNPGGSLAFHPVPQKQLRTTIFSSTAVGAEVETKTIEGYNSIADEDLERFGNDRWVPVMRHMAAGARLGSQLAWVTQCMYQGVEGPLMDEVDGALKLTKLGFQFLLDEPPRQLWTLFVAYVIRAKANPEILSLLCRIAAVEDASPQALASLTEAQQKALKDFQSCGLVNITEQTASYRPTPLGRALSGNGHSSAKKLASIIVEKNFRVYIHVDDCWDIQVSLLTLFARMEYRLPNVCAALLTKSSVLSALTHGIDVEAMIKFMEDRAHPCMRNDRGEPCIPYNVIKQLRLWSDERDRLRFTEGVMLEGLTEDMWQRGESRSREIDAYLWGDLESRGLVVLEERAEELIDFIKTGKKLQSGGWNALGGGGGGWAAAQ